LNHPFAAQAEETGDGGFLKEVVTVLACALDDVPGEWRRMLRAVTDHACRFTDTADAKHECKEVLAHRLDNLRGRARPGSLIMDSGDFKRTLFTVDTTVVGATAAASGGCALELAAATEWRERGPVYLETLRAAQMPGMYVVPRGCALPENLRVCYAIFDRVLNDNVRPWTMCETNHSEWAVRRRYDDDSAPVAWPNKYFTINCAGTCSVALVVIDEHGEANNERTAGFNTGERGVVTRAGKESDIPNFKGSYLGRFPLVSADFWTSDHLSERSRSADAVSGTRARGTLMLKRR
jgi:hypothetical protein